MLEVLNLKPTIMKFGGTSVADAPAFARVARIVREQEGALPVVVVSAMSGVTNALLRLVELSIEKHVQKAASELENQLVRHTEVARSLLAENEARAYESLIDGARSSVGELLLEVGKASAPLPALKDHIVSFGEQLSSELLTQVLRAFDVRAIHVDSRRLIVSDNEHGCANPLMNETTSRAQTELAPLVETGQVPVLDGFIAATSEGATTTLGRGGSDYSAAILGAALNAREIQIWTDVSGVLTADPRIVPDAHTVPVLSYQEAAELAYFGAKVLHPKTIQPAVERRIPVRVRNSRAPDEPFTSIVAEYEAAPQTVKAIAHKSGITTLQVTSARMLGAHGFLRALFEVCDRHRTVVDVVTTSEVSVSLSIDDATAVRELIPELRQLGAVEVEGRRTIICIIGEGLRHTPGIAARVFSAISDINVSMISFGASSVNLTFMVEEEHAGEAIRRLHRMCFGAERDASVVTRGRSPNMGLGRPKPTAEDAEVFEREAEETHGGRQEVAA